MDKQTKKEKIREIISGALLTVQLTSMCLSSGVLLGGLTGYSNMAYEDKKYDDMINKTQNSQEYQQFVSSVTDNAFLMYQNGQITYPEYASLVRSIDTKQAVEEYIANGGSKYSSDVVEKHYNEQQLVGSRSDTAMIVGVTAGLLSVGCAGAKTIINKKRDEDCVCEDSEMEQ